MISVLWHIPDVLPVDKHISVEEPLLSFVVAIYGDAYDNVKHLLLFNLLLDTWLFATAGLVFALASTDK